MFGFSLAEYSALSLQFTTYRWRPDSSDG